jgi:hypothetical protein
MGNKADIEFIFKIREGYINRREGGARTLALNLLRNLNIPRANFVGSEQLNLTPLTPVSLSPVYASSTSWCSGVDPDG